MPSVSQMVRLPPADTVGELERVIVIQSMASVQAPFEYAVKQTSTNPAAMSSVPGRYSVSMPVGLVKLPSPLEPQSTAL